MPLFDASAFPDAKRQEELIQANDGVDRLRDRLVDKIAQSAVPHVILKQTIQLFFQGHVRRALQLIEGGYDAHLAGRGLIVCVCTRALYETVASVMDFCDKLTDQLAKNDFEGALLLVSNRLFATRDKELIHIDDGFDNTAVNILTQIDKLSKHLPGLRDDYDFLSEFAHPNALSHHHFWVSGEDEISWSSRNTTQGHHLISAGRLLLLMDTGMTVLEASIDKHPFSGLPRGFRPMNEFDPSHPAILISGDGNPVRWTGKRHGSFRATAKHKWDGSVEWRGRMFVAWRAARWAP